MEKTDSGCVILKQKEYKELLLQVEENRSKEIKIGWNFNYTGFPSYGFKACGDFILSDNIIKQLKNIIEKINRKVDAKISENHDTITDRVCGRFADLSWYQRLFFNPKYLK